MNPEDTAACLFICSRQGTLHLTQYKVSCILNQKKTQSFFAPRALYCGSIPFQGPWDHLLTAVVVANRSTMKNGI